MTPSTMIRSFTIPGITQVGVGVSAGVGDTRIGVVPGTGAIRGIGVDLMPGDIPLILFIMKEEISTTDEEPILLAHTVAVSLQNQQV